MARIHALVRNTYLTIFLPLAIVIAVTGAAIAQLVYQSELESVQASDRELVRRAAGGLLGDLAPPLRHIRSLPNEVEIRAAISNPTPDNINHMAASLTTLLQRNTSYDRVRWIDETGMERILVDRTANPTRPVLRTRAELTDRSNRDYFRRASILPVGALYISGLGLTVDMSLGNAAQMPILRFATPITDERGNSRGILVINVSMESSFADLAKYVDGSLMLLNRHGQNLTGRDAVWNMQEGKVASPGIGRTYPAAWSEIGQNSDGQFQDESGLWSWVHLDQAKLGFLHADENSEPNWIVALHRTGPFLQEMWLKPWRVAGVVIVLLLLTILGFTHRITIWSRKSVEALEQKARADAIAFVQQQRIAALEEDRKSLATLAAIVSSSDDAIISKTLEGTITSWNVGAEKVFGYSEAEMIGKPMLTVFPQDRLDEEKVILSRIARGECVKHFITKRVRKDGVLIDVSATISPIHDENGKVIGASKVARDVTDAMNAAEELKRHRQNLEELVAQKT